MEKLKIHYEAILNSQKAFERSVKAYQQFINANREAKEAGIVSLAQHFVWFYESLWKYFKSYFGEQFDAEIAGSKEAFRMAESKGLITKEEKEQLFDIVDIRNTITHAYGEKNIEPVIEAIFKYQPLLNKLADIIIQLQKTTK